MRHHAQCRSYKGAPGADGQELADIETYGVQRWLGELALALREQYAYRRINRLKAAKTGISAPTLIIRGDRPHPFLGKKRRNSERRDAERISL
jgi:hypothetical protein